MEADVMFVIGPQVLQEKRKLIHKYYEKQYTATFEGR